MNPLSFVTIFTFGEVGTMLGLAAALPGGIPSLWLDLHAMRPWLFWLLLGGFCWVIGDLFQQYATKYVGISRAIPLSNTNQLWGFAWGVLVFGELSHTQGSARLLALAASGVMIAGAMLIAGAGVSAAESASCMRAVERECNRYNLDLAQTLRAQDGLESDSGGAGARRWWDYLILIAAVGVFAWSAVGVRIPRLTMQFPPALALIAILIAVLAVCGWMLWKKTRFA
jgi:drug/metabolite transporter (DMT)-like permease